VSREEESDVSVCYISPTEGTVLVLYSGATGGWTDITRFALWSREHRFSTLDCAHPPHSYLETFPQRVVCDWACLTTTWNGC
jgi:hypothetical protein